MVKKQLKMAVPISNPVLLFLFDFLEQQLLLKMIPSTSQSTSILPHFSQTVHTVFDGSREMVFFYQVPIFLLFLHQFQSGLLQLFVTTRAIDVRVSIGHLEHL